MARQDNYTFLTSAPVHRVITTMAVPTIISMLVTSIYNIVDTYYVGLINTQATAAVGVVFPVMAVIQAVGFFFGQGAGTYMSRQLGAKQIDDAHKMAATSFYSAIIFGVILSICGLIFLNPLAVLLGSTPTILPYTIKYLGVILLGTPFMTAAMVLNNQMRFEGNATQAMYGMISGAVLNVALVPLFTFTFRLGILGTAIGTVLSQIFGFVVLLVMSRRGENIHVELKNYSTKRRYYHEILRGGTPSLTRQGLASISTIMLNVAAGVYGDAAIAGMSIVTRIAFLIFAVIIGIGQGFQPFCGFNYGAKLFKRLRQGYFFSIKLDMLVLAITCVPAFIFAEQLIDLLRHDPDVVAVGAVALRWQLVALPLAAFVTISNMTLQTSGKSLAANVLAASRNGLFFIPLILLLPRIWGLLGVEVCQAVSDGLSFLLAIPLIIHYFRTLSNDVPSINHQDANCDAGPKDAPVR